MQFGPWTLTYAEPVKPGSRWYKLNLRKGEGKIWRDKADVRCNARAQTWPNKNNDANVRHLWLNGLDPDSCNALLAHVNRLWANSQTSGAGQSEGVMAAFE